MPVTAGQMIELVAVCQKADQLAYNVMHFRVVSIVTPPALEGEIADKFAGSVQGALAPLLADGAAFRGIMVRLWDGPNVGAFYYAKRNVAGTGGANAMPRQTSGLISLRTALSGRRNRGRIYIPFPSEELNSDQGHPNTTYMTTLAAYGALFLPTITLNTATSGNVILQNRVGHPIPKTGTDTDHYIYPTKWATQRRRGDYGRPNVLPDGLA